MRRPVRIPTILALLVVLLLVGVIAFVTQTFLKQPVDAQGSKTPKDIQVTNITNSSFTVTWKTDKPTRGIIQLKEANSSGPLVPFADERYAGNETSYVMHSVPVTDRKPNTTYKLYILEQNDTVHEENAYVVTTAPTVELPAPTTNSIGPVYGSAMFSDNTPASGAIVYLTMGQSQLLSAVVKPSGSYLIPINLIRSQDLQSFLPVNGKTDLTIEIKYNGDATEIMTDTANDSPVPEVVIGKTYDFRNQQSKRKTSGDETPIAQNKTSFENVLGTQNTKPAGSNYWPVQFTQPQNGAFLTTFYPYITGTGVPNMFVALTIGIIKPYTVSTKVGPDGTFTYQPKKPMGIGRQGITMTTKDQNNKPIALTHLFEIMKSGTQVLGDATPSATPIFTPEPTASPTAEIPTDTPIATETPVTATTFPTILLAGLGIAVTVMGIVVLAL